MNKQLTHAWRRLRPSPCRPEHAHNWNRDAWLEIAREWSMVSRRSALMEGFCRLTHGSNTIAMLWTRSMIHLYRVWNALSLLNVVKSCPCPSLRWPETLFNSDQPSQSAEDAVRQVMWSIGFCQTEMWQPTGPVSSAFSCREGEHVQRIDHCRVQQVSEDSNIVICHGEQLKVHAASALTDWLTH